MNTATRTQPPAGTPEYERHRRRQQAYGRWEPYTDAEPVRAHVRGLMAYGIGWMRAARLAGVPQNTVEKLLYGTPPRGCPPSKRVRPETARKLLAVQPDPALLAPAAETDATGTTRRLRALVAAGWPQSHLAARLGVHRANLGKTMNHDRVRVSTERAVRGLYDQLWRMDPRTEGVSARSYNRARAHGRNHQWAPPAAWDDDQIDDPTANPDWTGACGTPKGYGAHYRNAIPTCERCRSARRRTRAATTAPDPFGEDTA